MVALLTLLGIGAEIPYRAVDPTADHMQLDFGAIRQIPGSAIQLSSVQLPTKERLTFLRVATPCITFVNTGSVVATHVLFALQATTRDGRVVRRSTLDATGTFSPGIAIGDPIAPITNEAAGRTGACSDEIYTWNWGPPTDFNADPNAVNDPQPLDKNGPESLVASVAEIDFADGTSWNAGPNILADTPAAPGSGVRVARAFAWQPAATPQECVAYGNDGARAIAAVSFSFAHVSTGGTVVSEETWVDRTPLAPGKDRPDLCIPFDGTVSPLLGQDPYTNAAGITTGHRPTQLLVRVSHVDYANGESWDAPAAHATPMPSNRAEVDFTHAYWWPSSATARGTLTQFADSNIDLTSAYVWIPGLSQECVEFTNRSLLPIKTLYILFRHTAVDGDPLGTERMRATGPIEAGRSKFPRCETFENAGGFANLLLPVSWSGGGVATRDIYTTLGNRPQAYVAQLDASVDEVDYADGTVWKAPVASSSASL